MKCKLLYCTVLLSLLTNFATGAPSPLRNGGGEDIILQGFHWNSSRNTPEKWYQVLARMAPVIGQDGFTKIWLPPVWVDKSSWSDPAKGTSGGGEGYYWNDFDKNSAYGTDAELKQAATALTRAGVQVMYDVVPNHMNDKIPGVMVRFPRGYKLWRNDCTPPSDCDEGDPFEDGAADLNTASPEVSPRFMQEFRNLRDNYSAHDLRFDYVRGYSPERVDLWMKNFNDQAFCVGEFWKSPGEFPASDWRSKASWQDALKDWSDRSHCAVFDFALKERMQNGSIAEWRHGLNGNPVKSWREIAVTFVDNHDTGYSPGQYGGQHHWPLPDPMINLAYAYILLAPGIPVVYWPAMYDWGAWQPDPHAHSPAQECRHQGRLTDQFPDPIFRPGGRHQWHSTADTDGLGLRLEQSPRRLHPRYECRRATHPHLENRHDGTGCPPHAALRQRSAREQASGLRRRFTAGTERMGPCSCDPPATQHP